MDAPTAVGQSFDHADTLAFILIGAGAYRSTGRSGDGKSCVFETGL